MRYLGNKTRMIKNIEDLINELDVKGEVFCDLFTGSGSVADYFKDKYTIIANDVLFSSCVFAEAKVKHSDTPIFKKFKKEFGTSPFDYFTKKEYLFSNDNFIWTNYSPKGNRKFFTEEIANKIDGIRKDLEVIKNKGIICEDEYKFLLASLLETIMGLSNTTGTYEAFLKTWDSRANKKFVLNPLEIKKVSKVYSKKNKVYNEDANELIKRISGDILYLDTPYTITDYNSAYHLLETIALYDYPEIRGITGRRANKKEKSKYSIQSKALNAYEELIKNANFRNIIISYSTQSLIPIDELMNMLSKYSEDKPIIKYYPFREYKNIRESKKGENLREVLIYLKKKQEVKALIKSPLNYSGSKNYIVDQIINELPDTMGAFVDAMGGAFNVGINVENAKEVYYNEYNPFVFEIVDMLLKTDKEELINDVKKIVKRHNLSKNCKESYLKFREHYNNDKSPLYLFVLQMYCFQNQLRFNQNHDFNTPVGNCGCNDSTFERIRSFIPKAKNVITSNEDFNNLNIDDYPKDTVFYFDPPYIITNATYNDGKRGFKGWDEEEEKKLLKYLESINKNGQKFLLSNVIEHNGKTNELLQNWAVKNKFKIVRLIPHSGRYGARKEVLVKNY